MNGTMIQMNEWHNEWIRMIVWVNKWMNTHNCVSKQMNEYAWFWFWRIRMILILKHIFHTHECIICKTKWQHHLRSVLLIFFEGSTLCSTIFLMKIWWMQCTMNDNTMIRIFTMARIHLFKQIVCKIHLVARIEWKFVCAKWWCMKRINADALMNRSEWQDFEIVFHLIVVKCI